MDDEIKVVVGSVIYKEAADYIPDFLDSLHSQTNQNFDIVLINDNFLEEELLDILDDYLGWFGKRLQIRNSIASQNLIHHLRIELLRTVKLQSYDLIILVDCDDVCENRRVERTVDQYDQKYAFFYNELVDFQSKKVMPELPKEVMTIDSILQHNFLGLSNTSINMSHMPMEFIESLKDGNTNIFDWYLFSRIILAGGIGKKIQDTVTYYRLHSNNIAGKIEFSIESLKKEREIKIQHYMLLKAYCRKCEQLLLKYSNMSFSEDVSKKEDYVFWWGLIHV